MTVVKVGGAYVSAQELETIVAQLRRFFRGPLTFVAGGGEAADLVRKWDRDLELGSSHAHWLAIRAMSLQADLLARRLGLPLVEDLRACLDRDGVLDLRCELSRAPAEVPVGWHVTSDSIAAWAARRLAATSLVLLKSVGDRCTSIAEASVRGWVDPYFVEASRDLHIVWFNPKADGRSLQTSPMQLGQ